MRLQTYVGSQPPANKIRTSHLSRALWESPPGLFLSPLTDFFQPLGDPLLHAAVGGEVVAAAGERWREALHIGDGVSELVRVLIAGAVAELLHERRRSVAQMERHGIGGRGGDIGAR